LLEGTDVVAEDSRVWAVADPMTRTRRPARSRALVGRGSARLPERTSDSRWR